MPKTLTAARPQALVLPRHPPGALPRRILVVDDDPPCRNSLQRSLLRHGFEVYQAGDGQQALSLLADSRIDLIITDLCMPRMDGLELILRVSQQRSPPALIAVTGAGESDRMLLSASERGADEILLKPFSEGELLACVRRLLDRAA